MKSSPIRILIIIIIMTAIGTTIFLFQQNQAPARDSNFGVTFSSSYARELGLDEREVYRAILDDLGIRLVRLPVYWSQVERERDVFDWKLLDDLVGESERAGARVTLAIGAKVPRWPECYVPAWVEEKELEKELFAFLRKVVVRYQSSSAIIRWQIENEALLSFGEGCPALDPARILREIEVVRALDDRPIQLTVSGELESWVEHAALADVLGVSLYRETWHDLWGYFYYPVTPGFYRAHARKVAPFVDRVVISELQAEPWFSKPISDQSLLEWYERFDVEAFKTNVAFAKRVGFPEVYLWGVEWWYKLKVEGDARLWEAALDIY